jgi:hypothetical protein
MTRKNILLIALVLLLGGLSVYLNRARFKSETVQIGNRTVPFRGRVPRGQKPPANSLIFLLNRELALTAVRVVYVSDIETNKYPHPTWELISESNSVPVKDFIYGTNIRGMRPSVKGAVADPLQPGVKYRLFIEAGAIKAEHDFTAAKPPQ